MLEITLEINSSICVNCFDTFPFIYNFHYIYLYYECLYDTNVKLHTHFSCKYIYTYNIHASSICNNLI